MRSCTQELLESFDKAISSDPHAIIIANTVACSADIGSVIC